MIDLTKPIEVLKYASVAKVDGEDSVVMYYVVNASGGWKETSTSGTIKGRVLLTTDTNCTEAYRRLFESAPKMLDLLHQIVVDPFNAVHHATHAELLIEEIEGDAH